MYFLQATKRIMEGKGAMVVTIKYRRMKMKNLRATKLVELWGLTHSIDRIIVISISFTPSNTTM